MIKMKRYHAARSPRSISREKSSQSRAVTRTEKESDIIGGSEVVIGKVGRDSAKVQ